MTSINYKTQNLTVIDDQTIDWLVKVDQVKKPRHNVNYYELWTQDFVFGRLLYYKKSLLPIMYWFIEEGIGDYKVKCFNSILTDGDEMDILVGTYKEICIEMGNTLSIYIDETLIDLCNYLKRFNPTVKYENPFIRFTLFENFQRDWLDRELKTI